MKMLTWFGFAISILTILMAFVSTESIPIGEYLLEYPKNFGNKFTIPNDNPMQKEVVYLGKMLFYEPFYLLITKFHVQVVINRNYLLQMEKR
jgi:hypothetical protein